MRERIWLSALKVLGIFTLAIGLSACSMFERKSEKSEIAPSVVDVPSEAREVQAGLRHRILVLPFLDDRVERGAMAREEARKTVARELARTGAFVVVSPEDFPQDPKKFITPEGEYDLTQLARIAAGIGVTAVLEGKVMDLKARRLGDAVGLIRQTKASVDANVRIRIHAGKNGREVFNEIREANVETASTRLAERAMSDRFLEEDPELVRASVRKAVLGAIPQIVKTIEKLSWEGRVAMISGERVYINAGRLSGLQIGDVLKVLEEGDEVYDPETGRFIGKAPGRLKGTIEIVSYFGKDGAIAVLHSGSGFKENDLVELY